MAHRGRLNVLANFLQKRYSTIFREFEDNAKLSIGGSGDVKYHRGFSSEVTSRSNKKMVLCLPENPSHLEAIDPIVLGQAKAKQDLSEPGKILPILVHGDAAISGQGVVYESMQLMNLRGYSVRGTIHLVLNNQVGFTTLPDEGRSTRYCTDLAKTFRAPVFHVNAEDPEGCVFIAKLAIRLRQKFGCDVFIDLNGYRKYGHNEGDEPLFTQPLQQKLIQSKQSIREIYCQNLLTKGHVEEVLVNEMEEKFKTTLKDALASAQAADQLLEPHEILGHSWEALVANQKGSPFDLIPTSVDPDLLTFILKETAKIPVGFHLHPKLQKMFEARLNASRFDWSTAEWLAFGSLLMEKISIRCSGQDMERGTFSQRHMAWVDQEDETRYFPLAHLRGDQGRFEIFNSPLSEYAVMGFELGYSWSAPQTLVIWEAQFGDFFNGAQIIIDQFLSSAEQKWHRPSSLVLLLPHAFEGQGPEHSSARLERFLQLCAEDNFRIVNPSTPAQYFHILRKQALQKCKKPLVLFTPKSLLRDPACTSSLIEFSEGSFQEVLDDPQPPENPKVLLLCCGHIFYDLLKERKNRKEFWIVRIEQLYPLHKEKLKKLISLHEVLDVRYVQEEPKNMGAWGFLSSQLQELLPANASLRYVGRKASASPCSGSRREHEEELKILLQEAFSESSD
jgi:2-oxoglutarate dehydrogenase E1 component